MFFQQDSTQLHQYFQVLQGQKVVVIGHINPDGDSIGSQVGLCRLLRGVGIEAVCLSADPFPIKLQAFVGDTPVMHVNQFDAKGWVPLAVDCADIGRIGSAINGKLASPIMLNIDHHISNTRYGVRNVVYPEASATAEIVAGIALDNDYKLDKTCAQALLLGITTDTGNFLFNTTTAQTFRIAARLVDCGAQPAQIHAELYQQDKLPRLLLLQRFLGSLRLELDGRVCIGVLTQADYQALEEKYEDSEGFVDYTRTLSFVVIGACLDVRGGKIKVSLRAKSPQARLDILAQSFSGGGHPTAAGFTFEGTLEGFYDVFLKALRKHLSLYS